VTSIIERVDLGCARKSMLVLISLTAALILADLQPLLRRSFDGGGFEYGQSLIRLLCLLHNLSCL
jgi:hypothetical protein